MPVHTHPILRSREEAMEDAGLIQPLDSVGVTIFKNLEAQGFPKLLPVSDGYKFNGKHYKQKDHDKNQ